MKKHVKLKFFTFALLLFSFNVMDSVAQEKNLTVIVKNASLQEVFNAIEKQTTYRFSYRNVVVDSLKNITISKTNATVLSILDEVLAGRNLSYNMVSSKSIVISDVRQAPEDREKQSLRKYAGTVTDGESEPVIGASVVEKGTSNGVVTDLDGKFALNVAKGTTLEISFIGYVTQEIKTADQTTLHITLKEDTKVLDEVVVVGYGTTLRKNLTTSIAKVDANKVQKAGVSNATQLLMGRAAGLQATMASAQPGGKVDISIRGAGDPIYVVDGVILPGGGVVDDENGMHALPASVNRGGLAGINPDDIESIEILKDASAAIYGIGAANGVILITTKSGQSGKVKISYSGNMSIVKNYPYLDVLKSPDYMRYTNIFKKEDYIFANKQGIYGSTSYDGKAEQPYTDAQIAAATTTDWMDQVLRNGSINSHNVTVQGGQKELNYYLSGSFFEQIGTVSAADMKRYTLHTRVSSQLFDFLKLTAVINYNRNDNNNGFVGAPSGGRGEQASGALTSAMYYPPTLPLKDADGKNTAYNEYPDPVGMERITNKSLLEGTNINLSFDVDLIKNMLTAKFLYGYNKDRLSRSVYIPSDIWYDLLYKSRGALAEDARQNITMEGTIAFNKNIRGIVGINAVVGMGRYLNNSNGLSDGYDFIHDAIGNSNIGAATGTHSPNSSKGGSERRSQFGRASFDILDRYVISTTLRRDGTDKFFPDKKYALFPSVSAAWKIINEDFMSGLRGTVNMLKLRVSYGITGNDNLGTRLYGTYGPSTSDNNKINFYEGSSYISYTKDGLNYPNVTWERTVMKNIGLDFSIFKDRLSGSFDVFQNDITDMLGDATTSYLSMFGTYPVNGGHISRYGWDATLTSKNIQTPLFRWDSYFSLSHYNSIWKERMPNYDYAPYQVKDNEPVNAVYFYRTDGIVNADKSNMPAYQPDGYQVPGMPIIKDLDGNGTIDVKDVDMKNGIPALYWGLGNTFTYKNWDLDVFIYSQLGLKKYNYVYTWANVGKMTAGLNEGEIIKDVWTSQNTAGTLPGLAYFLGGATLPEGAGTDVGYENASFLRVRNITLGYNLGGNQLGAWGKYISTLRVYLDAQNPVCFSSFKIFDPELYLGDRGDKGNAAQYPQVRTFSLGLKLSF